MSASNVVKFPTGRIVRERFYRCKDSPERVELDAALDSIYAAITALQRQKASVLARLHAHIDAKVRDVPALLPTKPEGDAA